MSDSTTGAAMSATKPQPPVRAGEMFALMERARKGDDSCLPQQRALFDAGPRRGGLIDHYGSSAAWLESALVKEYAGKNLAVKEAMKRKLAAVKAELAGPDPTPMERLLAERAAVCWFIVNAYELVYAGAGSITLGQADYHQKRIDRAHKRYLSALKTLATIRKLALPAFQVNIAEKQVNVAGTNTAG